MGGGEGDALELDLHLVHNCAQADSIGAIPLLRPRSACAQDLAESWMRRLQI